MKLSLIIPVLNEAKTISSFLENLQACRAQHTIEIIVVDGGSVDNTIELARPYVDCIISSCKGRAIQMNAGADVSCGDVLLFLHSDTLFPCAVFPFLEKKFQWGFYRIRLSGQHFLLRIVEKMMVWRSTFTHVATGDQCLFVARKVFFGVGGFSAIPLMEDVDMCKKLRKITPPLIVNDTVTTSSRRWEKNGIIKTIIVMWYLRTLYFLGVPPERLAKKYYG